MQADRRGDVHLQSAWSYYIAGSSKSAREQLKAALTVRPDLQVIPDFYSPDFANLAAAVRAEVAGANVPAVDVEELKRSARAKLEDGKTEEVALRPEAGGELQRPGGLSHRGGGGGPAGPDRGRRRRAPQGVGARAPGGQLDADRSGCPRARLRFRRARRR